MLWCIFMKEKNLDPSLHGNFSCKFFYLSGLDLWTKVLVWATLDIFFIKKEKEKKRTKIIIIKAFLPWFVVGFLDSTLTQSFVLYLLFFFFFYLFFLSLVFWLVTLTCIHILNDALSICCLACHFFPFHFLSLLGVPRGVKRPEPSTAQALHGPWPARAVLGLSRWHGPGPVHEHGPSP